MSDNVLILIIGVVSGLITYIVVKAASRWFKYRFQPWHEAQNYNDIDINDVWEEAYIPLRSGEHEIEQAIYQFESDTAC